MNASPFLDLLPLGLQKRGTHEANCAEAMPTGMGFSGAWDRSSPEETPVKQKATLKELSNWGDLTNSGFTNFSDSVFITIFFDIPQKESRYSGSLATFEAITSL